MKQDFLYSVDREYAHPIERVWHAWTDAAELEAWYHPTILSVVPGSVTSDARPGGTWAVAVDVPMNDFVAYFFGTYSVIDQHKRIEHSMSYTQSREEFDLRPADAESHQIVIEFEDRDGKTWVKFNQFGYLPPEQVQATIDGMTSYFDSLEQYLDWKN